MKKSMKLLLATASIAALSVVPVFAVSCGKTNSSTSNTSDSSQSSQAVTISSTAANGYTDLVNKIYLGDITCGGVWGDARATILKVHPDAQTKLVAIGATKIIANDGIQARPDLKKGDVERIQQAFIDAINKAKNTPALQIQNGAGKMETVFDVYDHSGYSKTSANTEITYDTENDQKPAIQTPLVDGSDFFNKDGSFNKSKTLNITFIPSNDPALVKQASEKLQKYFNDTLGWNVKMVVSSDYDTAASQLAIGSTDLAFLPAGTWAEKAGKSNFILVAGRPVQLIDPYKSVDNTTSAAVNDEKSLVEAFNNYMTYTQTEGAQKAGISKLYVPGLKEDRPASQANYPENIKNAVDSLQSEETLPTVGYYRAYIIARADSPFAQKCLDALKTQGDNWKLKWDDVKAYFTTYGYTSKTSSSSYIYPNAWFKKHFEGFKSFE